jgi:hypothetical protein
LTVLEKNIEIHNTNHVLLYPKNPDEPGKAITPKLHSLLHLANQIRMFGALLGILCASGMSQRMLDLKKKYE